MAEPAVDAVAPWAETIAELVRALEAAAVESDWSEAQRVTAELAALLAAPPASVGRQYEPLFRHAFQAVGRVSAAARAAQDAVRAELQQLASGRKAVAAYG
ncbi:MAG: hypothetical protein K2Y51_24200 [Gammaproteobacteria bacterium]|jgi:hypothetical protein|nr:hypothetical protein [Gammaproteobacteria bacterium]